MGGKAITIAGGTGTGKTTLAKELVSNNPNCLVFDINNEYDLDEIDLSKPYTGGQYRYTGMDFKKFLNLIEENGQRKVMNTDVVLEDCSGFMKGQVGARALQIFQAKRHTNNNYYFIYHAVELIPKDIFRFTNIFALFYTNETPQMICKRFPQIKIEVANWVQKEFKRGNKHYKKIIKLM